MQWRREYVQVSPHRAAALASLLVAIAGGALLLFLPGSGVLLLGVAALLRLCAVRFGQRTTLACSVPGFTVQQTGQPDRHYRWDEVGAVGLFAGKSRPFLCVELRDGRILRLTDRTTRFGELVEFVTAMTPHLRRSAAFRDQSKEGELVCVGAGCDG